MKKIILVLIILLLPPLSTRVFAQENSKGVISSSCVVTSTPEAESEIIGVLSIGTVVKISEEKQNDKYYVDSPWVDGWVSSADIIFDVGGWENSDELKVITIPQEPLYINASVNRPAALFREPNLGSNLVGKVGMGSVVRILEYVNHDFSMVETKSGLIGFMAADALTEGDLDFINNHNSKSSNLAIGTIDVTPPSEGIINTTSNVREHPSRKTGILAILRNGTKVTVIENKRNNWCLIESEDGLQGYVRSFCISADGKAYNGKLINNTSVFSENDIESEILGEAPKNTYLRVIDITENGWYKVILMRSRVGYIPAEAVQIIE